MANLEARMSSDAAKASGGKYQVFLSFRGPDTRHKFTDFLYHYLDQAGVRVFMDSEELHIGEVIGETLRSAIDNSIIYIPIFSPTYATSKWCLRELARIVDNVSNSDGKKSIIPIFFLVIPDDVKLKTSRYSGALLEHENNYPSEVEAWRDALKEAGKIKGSSVEEQKSLAEIVNVVVQRVLHELKTKKKLVTEHLVGVQTQVDKLIESLDVKQLDVRLFEIYGMSGLGKTTIAKVVFNKLYSHFGKYCCFLEDVRENLTKESIVQLQKNLLYEIVGSKCAEKVWDREQGMMTIGEILRDKKVLVVLDDVGDNVTIKNLIGNSKLHQGSRIVITTRERNTLRDGEFEGSITRYEMLRMNDDPALRLFCRHAFDTNSPPEDYQELSSSIVKLMEGLPIAVEVVGSSLKKKDKPFWKETLDWLKKRPAQGIDDKLRISYNGLNYEQQQIFLDIACFLFNEKKTDATYMWADCKFYPAMGIEVLTKRCLIKILDNNKLWMHNQLVNLGRNIVYEECPSILEKRSRLWVPEEAVKIIKSNMEKEKVQAIKIDGLNYSIEIKNEEFEKLQNLRLLNLGNGTYAVDFAKCCSQLRWISWHSPHWDLRGDNMNLNNLVVFKLHDSSFTDNAKAWDLIKSARNLKVLSLTQCCGITTIPDFSKCSRLERLSLAHCNGLKRIERFIGDMKFLIELEIEWCESLTYLPEEEWAPVNLERLSLRGCSRLRELPCSLGNLTSLKELDSSKTGITKLPNSMNELLKLKSFLLTDKTMMEFPKFIGKLGSLRLLGFPKNGSYFLKHHIWQLPSGISMLKILEEMDLLGRDKMTSEIPVAVGDMSPFRILNLSSTQICEIPRNKDVLHDLQTLNLRNCHETQQLLELRTRTSNMLHQHASSLPELAFLPRLDLKTDEELSSSLLRLDLLCFNFRWANLLPSSLILRNLTILELYYVDVQDIPLDRFPGLECLTVDGCEKLQSLTISLENLRQTHVLSCPELLDISFSCSEKLESFFVFRCGSLETIKWLDCGKNLEKLEIQQCDELTDVCGLEHLESLKSLEVTQCPSLRRLISASCKNIPGDCLVKIQGCGAVIKDSTPSDPPGMPLSRYVQEIIPDSSNFESKSNKVKRDRTVKSAPVLAKTVKGSGTICASNPGSDPQKRGRARGIASSPRNDKASRLGRNATSTSEMGTAPNYERGTVSSSQRSATLSTGRGQRFNFSKGHHFELRRGTAVGLGTDRGSSSRRGITKMGRSQKSGHDEDSDFGSVGDREIDGTSSIDDFQPDMGNVDCLKALGNRRQTRDRGIGHYGSVNGGKTTSLENRQKNENEIGEPASQNDVVWSSCLRREGVEHCERSFKATTKVEDERDLSSVERDRTMETDQVPAKKAEQGGWLQV